VKWILQPADVGSLCSTYHHHCFGIRLMYVNISTLICS